MMTRKLIIVIGLLFASPVLAQQTARGQGVISVSNATPPSPGLGWTDVTGVQIPISVPCVPNPGPVGACPGVVNAWNSAIADTNRNRLWLCDMGGHNDYGGNECYYFDLATNTAHLAVPSTTPTTQVGCLDSTSDGRPASRHQYGGQVYIPVSSFNPGGDVLVQFGGVPYCASGGFLFNNTWKLTLASAVPTCTGLCGWQQLSPTCTGMGSTCPSDSNGNAQMQYDPNTGLVFLNESTFGLWSYSLNSNTYTFLASAPSSLGLHTNTVIDPVHKLLLRFGDGGGQKISIATGSSYAVTNLTMTGCNTLSGGTLASANNGGLQWDPVLQLVVAWPDFGPGVYLYNDQTDSCTTQTYLANAPPDSAHTGSPSTTNGTFKRFSYFPAMGEYVLINDFNIDVHLLRLTNPTTEFNTQCAATGVLSCQGFDTSAALAGNTAAGVPVTSCGLVCPTIDNTTFEAGTGSLHFTVPAGATAPNTSGSWNTNFVPDLSQQIDSLINGDPLSLTTACGGSPCPNTVYVQWRQRIDSGMLQHFANSNGWKTLILGEGDAKMGSTFYQAFSCSDIETDTQNSSQFQIAQMYYSCGLFLDQYFNLYTPTGRTDGSGNAIISPENVAGGYLLCTYAASINIPTVPPCFPYVANTWMTFQIEVSVGTWYPTGTNSVGGPPATFVHNSTIKMWAGLPGQVSQLIIDYHPGATSPACDAVQQPIPACQTGFDLSNPTAYTSSNTTPCTTTSAAPGNCQLDGYGNPIREKFGKVWLLPYQTNLNCPACTVANMWIDNLIISKNRIADPLF